MPRGNEPEIRVAGTLAFVERLRNINGRRMVKIHKFDGKMFTKPEMLDRYIEALQQARDYLTSRKRSADAYEVLDEGLVE